MFQPAATSGRTRTGEANSRNRSPTPIASSGGNNRRCSSPTTITIIKTATSNVSVSNRAISTGKRRLISPLSSTPRKDTAAEYNYRKGTSSNKLNESLWPSTMRSLTVSFQSDNLREKHVTNHQAIMMDRNYRPSSCNETQKKQNEKARSPLRGKNYLSENSKPIEIGVGKVSSSMSTKKSPDFTDKATKKSSLLQSGSSLRSLRRLSLDNMCNNKPSQNPINITSFDDNSPIVDVRSKKLDPCARSQYLGSSSSCFSRGISPSKSKTSSPVPLRGPSPSRSSRTSSPLRQSNNHPTSVLSFIADIKKGKKTASHIENVHQLRMLYNRHLQWRYANDQARISHHLQIQKAEITLFNTWSGMRYLWQSVNEKKRKLLHIKLHSKLYSVIKAQLMYLDVWESMEKDHTESLIFAIKNLQSCTLHLPVTGGARGDIRPVKAAFCSALGVLQAMGSSMSILLSQMDKMYCLVSEVANVLAQERAMLDECEALLGSTLALQVEEDSLRIHLIQLKEG